MVIGSRIEGGNGTGTLNLSAGVRKTIQSIKEIVGNHSDADIYVALKETNMDPNETAQKLLNQDPFHEVKRKRDKKKEVTSFKEPVLIKPRKPTEQLVQGLKPNTYSDRNRFRRAGFFRNNVSDAGRTRQFRVVKDNRMNQNETIERKPHAKSSVVVTTKEPLTSTPSEKSSAEVSKTLKSTPFDSVSKQVKGVSLTASGRRPLVSKVAPPLQVATKPQDLVTSPNSSVVGVYSSSSDPVHIPSRPAANVGAIKREVGPVGGRRQATLENLAKVASVPASNTKDQFRCFPAVSKGDQHPHSNVAESVPSGSRSFNNHYSSRSHQQLVTHPKVPQANKEWKPKPSQKPSVTELGVIGMPKKSPAKKAKDLATEGTQPQEKLLSNEDQNVIIAAHIRVSETDRIRLTFGSLGIESDQPETCGHVDEPLASSPEYCLEVTSGSGNKQTDEQSSGSASPEPQSTDRVESSSSSNPPQNYTNIGLVRHSSSRSSEPKGPTSELPSFTGAYDPRTGYDISYLRPASDEYLSGQMLQIPQEGFVGNSIPGSSSSSSSTIAMIQAPPPQMYPPPPQVHHLPHFNLMPYRQFLSPVYVPPMVMPPGYSNNPPVPTYPSTGSSYVMIGGANKYAAAAAAAQYKSVTGNGNFDDSSRFKYKVDGNIYAPPPPQAVETSELWRDAHHHYTYHHHTPAASSSFNAQSSHMQFPVGGLYHHHHHPSPAHHNAGQPQPPPPTQLTWTANF